MRSRQSVVSAIGGAALAVALTGLGVGAQTATSVFFGAPSEPPRAYDLDRSGGPDAGTWGLTVFSEGASPRVDAGPLNSDNLDRTDDSLWYRTGDITLFSPTNFDEIARFAQDAVAGKSRHWPDGGVRKWTKMVLTIDYTGRTRDGKTGKRWRIQYTITPWTVTSRESAKTRFGSVDGKTYVFSASATVDG